MNLAGLIYFMSYLIVMVADLVLKFHSNFLVYLCKVKPLVIWKLCV